MRRGRRCRCPATWPALPLESFDARAHPHGWEPPGFDDAGWRQGRTRSRRSTPAATATRTRRASRSACCGRRCARRSPAGRATRRCCSSADRSAGRRAPTRCARCSPTRPGRRARGRRRARPTAERVVASTSAASRRGTRRRCAVERRGGGHRRRRGRGRAPRRATAGSCRSASTPGFRYVVPGRRPAERSSRFDVIGTRYLHASVRTPERRRAAPSSSWPSTTGSGPGPRARRSSAPTRC